MIHTLNWKDSGDTHSTAEYTFRSGKIIRTYYCEVTYFADNGPKDSWHAMIYVSDHPIGGKFNVHKMLIGYYVTKKSAMKAINNLTPLFYFGESEI